MKILLVSIPLEFPLAGYCLASQISAVPGLKDCEVSLLTLDASRLNTYHKKTTEIWRYIAHIETRSPDVVAFSIYLWNVLAADELISLTSQLFPGISIIIGGPEVATPKVIEAYFKKGGITAAVRGEGEAAMVDILQRLSQSKGLKNILGCSYEANGAVVHEPERPVQSRIEYPSPYTSGWVDESCFDRFSNGRFVKGAYPRAIIETYRGCYMECAYCQWGNGSKKRSKFPGSRVFDELTWLISRNIAKIFIVDAMFGYNLGTAKAILRHIISEKQRYNVATDIVCYHNQDLSDHELFDLYRDAGVRVEVDIQSANKTVLKKIGRARWSGQTFDRHLKLLRAHQVKTTGAADLIIGLPGDCLASFEASVDFILSRGLAVGLYQTSVIPGTRISESVEQEQVIHSAAAPRSVFQHSSFPVGDMVEARLLGHGIDFFQRYPCTAALLCRVTGKKQVALCREIGRIIWEEYDLMYGETWQYNFVLSGRQSILEETIALICHPGEMTQIVLELFKLESAIRSVSLVENVIKADSLLDKACFFSSTSENLDQALDFKRERVKIVPLNYRVDHWYEIIKQGRLPEGEPEPLDRVCAAALVYLAPDGRPGYHVIDRDITLGLLDRLNGYFSLEACLDNLLGGQWRQKDMSLLWQTIDTLKRASLIIPGEWTRNQTVLQFNTGPMPVPREMPERPDAAASD